MSASSRSCSRMKRRISLSPLPASPVNSGEPFMMMAMREPPSFGSLAWASMWSRKRSCPSLIRGRPGPKRPAAPRGVLHEEVRLGHRPGLRVHLLAEEMNVGLRVYGRAEDVAVPAQPDRDVLLGDRQHAAGAAAGVVDSADNAPAADARLV